MKTPADLSPELSVWMRLQMTIAAGRAVESLRTELRAQEDFADGLLIVLAQLVPQLLIDCPALAAKIGPVWRAASRRFDEIGAGATPQNDESAHQLHAQKLLFTACASIGLWAPTAKAKMPTRPRRPQA